MSEPYEMKQNIEALDEIYTTYHPPLTSRFEEDLATYWGRPWGVDTEVGKLRAVLLCRPGKEILAIEAPLGKWRYTEKPDINEMEKDFEILKGIFLQEGVGVVERKPESNDPPRLVKSIYARDPSFTVKGGAIIGRMYDALRRGEELPTLQTYAEIGCPVLHTIHGGGTMEGGSVTWIDPKHLAIGITYRGNEEGARQVKEVIATIDPTIDVRFVQFDHPSGHIDVPLTMVNCRTAIVDKRILPEDFVTYLEKEVKIEVVEKPLNTYVEGTLVLEPGKVMFDMGPQEEKKKGYKLLKDLGLEVLPVELNTLTYPRNSGTLHCLTMPLIRDTEPLV
jgi:N-dimethylarginine dimethylaminohydrolase